MNSSSQRSEHPANFSGRWICYVGATTATRLWTSSLYSSATSAERRRTRGHFELVEYKQNSSETTWQIRQIRQTVAFHCATGELGSLDARAAGSTRTEESARESLKCPSVFVTARLVISRRLSLQRRFCSMHIQSPYRSHSILLLSRTIRCACFHAYAVLFIISFIKGATYL